MYKQRVILTSFSMIALLATACGSNELPSIDAGDDLSATTGRSVALSATASDPEQDELFFEWQLSAPEGGEATLENADSATPSFTPDIAGEWTATVSVWDDPDRPAEDAVTDEIIITVTDNQLPTVSAGDDLAGTTGTEITLAATASDADGHDLFFEWTLTAPQGGTATLTGADSASASFTPDVAGQWTAIISVWDDENKPAEDAVTDELVITVTDPAP